eukprot:GAHX01006357.1.p1 GENE.GAHX01006357.1~~GAHX01006357.1.p1  ORF type:complete len:63 (-),score=0.39 GAHX01006357.1:272-460(-)
MTSQRIYDENLSDPSEITIAVLLLKLQQLLFSCLIYHGCKIDKQFVSKMINDVYHFFLNVFV